MHEFRRNFSSPGRQLISEQDVVNLLAKNRALMGREIAEHFGLDYYEDRDMLLRLWAVCTTSSTIRTKTVGTRYLRVDKDTGVAGITPSVAREFADFTALGLEAGELASKAEQVLDYHFKVSNGKKDLARRIVAECERKAAEHCQPSILEASVCFLLVGDVAYGMSSDFRREVDGEYVKGSDIDMVIVHSGAVPPAMIKALDAAIYNRKWLALKQEREEVDYIIKSVDAVREQAAMATPKAMAASKIVLESVLIHGSLSLYKTVRGFITSSGASEKLRAMACQAAKLRAAEEKHLLEELVGSRHHNLFKSPVNSRELYG